VQKLLRRLNKLTIGPALKIGFLKSLMQARYSIEALGHYGLAKEKYAHFTSPIRRYADLIVHRTLFQNFKIPVGKLARIADHISTTERNSSDAERDSKDVKLFAFLQKQIEERNLVPYDAHVTDVRNFGLFIDVPDLGMRGLIPLSRMDDDFYEFDSARVRVIGRRSKRVIGLGDVIEVIVDRVDRAKKEVDFRPAGSSPGRGRSSSSKGRGGRGRTVNRSGKDGGGGGNRSGDSRKKSGSRSRRSDKPKSRDGKPKSDRSKRSQQSKKRPSRSRSSSPKRSNQGDSQKRSGGGGRRRK
jgi:ribonuclease R